MVPESVTWLVLYSCLAVFTIIGNSLSVAVFLKNSRLRRMRTSMLLINLAVADLLVGAVAVPMYMVFQWPQSTLAKSASFSISYAAIDILTGFASLFGLSVIGLERAFSVFWPHRHRTVGKLPYLAAVVLCWLLSSLQVLLRVLTHKNIVEFRIFFYNMMIALSLVLVVMLSTYTAVWYKVRARQNELRMRSKRRYIRESVERERKLILTLSIVTGVFLITWLPFHVLNIFVFFCIKCRPNKLSVFLNLISAVKLLHYSNSFMNLIIYSFRFPDFRRTLCYFFGRNLRVHPVQSNVIGAMSSMNTNNQSPLETEGASKVFQ